MFRRSSHSVWDCRYHLVWATKRRRKALREEHEREYCERLLRRAAEKYDVEVLAMEVDEDHVHAYVEIPPKMSVGKAVRVMKGLSAHYFFLKFPGVRKRLWGGSLWSPSYFVRTVGEGVTAETVRKYIEHHAERTALGPAQAELFAKAKTKRKV